MRKELKKSLIHIIRTWQLFENASVQELNDSILPENKDDFWKAEKNSMFLNISNSNRGIKDHYFEVNIFLIVEENSDQESIDLIDNFEDTIYDKISSQFNILDITKTNHSFHFLHDDEYFIHGEIFDVNPKQIVYKMSLTITGEKL